MTGEEYDFADRALSFMGRLDALQAAQSEWSQRTFGSDEKRGPRGPLLHLAKEADEAAQEEVGSAKQLKEFGDVFLLTLESFRRGKRTIDEVLEAAIAKHAENRLRVWNVIDAEEPIFHKKEPSFRIKPLEWQDSQFDVNLKRAETIFGFYWVQYNPMFETDFAWGFHFHDFTDEEQHCCMSFDQGKQLAWENWQERIKSALIEAE